MTPFSNRKYQRVARAAASTSREPSLYYMSEDMESVEEKRGVWIKK